MRLILICAWLLFSSVASGQTKILYIGNSLTYYNDVPGLIERIGKQDGKKIFSVTTFLKPNYSLEDHWTDGSVIEQLKTNYFDFVVLQQGPSAMEESRQSLVEYALKFAELCKTMNNRMAFYMVWPSKERRFDFDNVVKSYTLAADTTQALLCPVGISWLEVLKRDKDFPLYGPDHFHPSESGSLLAAMIIYSTLFKKQDLGFVALNKLKLNSVTEKQFQLLKSVAASLSSVK